MIRFSQHALLKLHQRGISPRFVSKAISSPDYKFLGYSGRKIAYRRFGKLYLKVIYKIEEKDTIVITQHWDEKFKPK